MNHDISSYEQQQADIFAELEPVFNKYASVQVHARMSSIAGSDSHIDMEEPA